jgi:hypothetical protein
VSTPTFFLGTHDPSWLAKTNVPLFVSHVRLKNRKTLPRATCTWALDSGGFSELSLHGRWTVSPADYVAAVRRYRDEIGGLQWAAIQDYMCEPQMLAKTGLSVVEHQRRTVASYIELKTLAPEIPWCPVLQGWSLGEYYDCWQMYEKAGVDLKLLPIVGVGTVCRRQATIRTSFLLGDLAREGLRLHGFGFKIEGLRNAAEHLVSADSMAWSFHARKNPGGLGHSHKHCGNCLEYALGWRDELLGSMAAKGRAA